MFKTPLRPANTATYRTRNAVLGSEAIPGANRPSPQQTSAYFNAYGWTASASFQTVSNHQAIPYRVMGDFRAIFDAELFQDPCAICADRFCAE